MRKTTLIILLALAASGIHSYAQQFYIKGGIGYALPMPGQTKDQLGNVLNGTVTNTSTSTSYQLKSASFSAGVHGQVGGGYMFTPNIGIELDADINLAPQTYTASVSGEVNSSSVTYNYTGERQANNTVLLMPSLIVKTDNKKCDVYMRMGIALPVNSGIKLRETYVYQTGDIDILRWDVKNYFSPGFDAATGIKFNIGTDVTIFGELSILYMALSREERSLTTANLNGHTYGPSQLTGITQYHYTQNGTRDGAGNDNAFSQPFSNIGITAGISYAIRHAQRKSPRTGHKK